VAPLDVCSERVDRPEGTTGTQSADPVAAMILELMFEPRLAVAEQLEVTLVWRQGADIRLEVTECMSSTGL
jgi:hypothetical protein